VEAHALGTSIGAATTGAGSGAHAVLAMAASIAERIKRTTVSSFIVE
jgi:hypothetical protein